MLDSYFFIPGDKPRFLKKLGELNSDYFVIDLEESVSVNNKTEALSQVNKLNPGSNTFVRIPFRENAYSKDQLVALIHKFQGRVIIPKVVDANDVKTVLALDNFKFPLKLIYLVENPTCMLNLPKILEQYAEHTHAIGFGSHDFCSVMGVKNNLEHLSFYRNHLILIARAHGINYLDGADMNLRDLTEFEQECLFAFNSGADGKFVIHPDQLRKMYEIDYLSAEEIGKMKEVHKMASAIGNSEMDIIEFEGKVYEKPHLNRIEKLLNSLQKNQS